MRRCLSAPRRRSLEAALVVLLLNAVSAGAQGVTGDWGGARTSLAQSGVAVRGDVTGFLQGMVSGTGDEDWDAVGRYDAYADFDFGKMKLVGGLGFHAHVEGRFGQAPTNFGGQLWPSNTAGILPLGGSTPAATALFATFPLGKRTNVMLGKISAMDLLASDPVLGGLGTQRFMNFVFVAPPSGVTPPTLMGGILLHQRATFGLTFMVYDPEDRTRDYLPGNLFETGVNMSLSGKWSGAIAGRATSLAATAAVSTKRGADLEDVLAPPGFVTEGRKGSYNVALQFNHRLASSKQVEGKGLDVAVKVATADGNPNVVQSSLLVGLVGQALIPHRPHDSFGIGGFAFNLSNALQNGLDPLLDVNDEQGLEAWYCFAMTPWFKLTADAQYVNPVRGRSDAALVAALRLNVVF